MFRVGVDAQPDRRRHDCAGAGNHALPPEFHFHCLVRPGKLGPENFYSHRPDGTHARLRARRRGCSPPGLLSLDHRVVSVPDVEVSREPPLEIMNDGEETTRQSFSWVRRWSAGLNLIITVSTVFAIM